MDTMYGFAGALLAVWGGSEAWQRAFPLHGAPFGTYMVRRAARLLGRAGLVLVAIVIGVGGFHAPASAVLLGALAGWLGAAGREAWGERAELRAAGSGGRSA